MIKEFDMELLERLSKGYLGARKKENKTIPESIKEDLRRTMKDLNMVRKKRWMNS